MVNMELGHRCTSAQLQHEAVKLLMIKSENDFTGTAITSASNILVPDRMH